MKTNRSFNILQYMIYLSVSNKAQKISYRSPGILALLSISVQGKIQN
jgi:hypothetical protein